jgi:hypothetical protein
MSSGTRLMAWLLAVMIQHMTQQQPQKQQQQQQEREQRQLRLLLMCQQMKQSKQVCS